MISPIRRFQHSAALLLATMAVVSLEGCSDPPPPKEKKVVAKPVDPGPPPAKSVDELITVHGFDDRVWMDERQAPPTDEMRIGLLTFFDGFVTGRADRIRPFLGPTEQEELAVLEASGMLAQLADEIEGVEIRVGATNEGQPAVLGLYEFADRVEGQMWEVASQPGGPRGGTSYVFTAAYTPPGLADWLGKDPFADWYDAVQAERDQLHGIDMGIEAAKGNAVDPGEDPFAAPSGGSSSPGPRGPGM